MNNLFPREFQTSNGQVLVIDRCRLDEIDEVSNFMHKHFSDTIPNRYIIPYDTVWAEIFHNFLPIYLNYLVKQSVSFTVRDPKNSNQLVAVRINELEQRHGTDEQVTIPKELIIFNILGSLNKDINLFDLYNTDTILHLAMVTVSGDYGRLGLAGELYKISIEIAENMGMKAIVTEAVNAFAQAAARKFGLQTLKEIVYKEFELEDGSRPFASLVQEMGEHRTAKLMGRRLLPTITTNE